MAIKTISIELDVYERLKRAKRTERESFSSVLRRARWEGEPVAGERILETWRRLTAARPDTPDERDLKVVERRARRRFARRCSAWDARS